MWPLLIASALGAGLGNEKHKRAEQIENSDRKLASATARYSPWTGMAPQQIRMAGSHLGDIAGGALSGFSVGQSAEGMFNKPEGSWWDALKKKPEGPQAMAGSQQNDLMNYLSRA